LLLKNKMSSESTGAGSIKKIVVKGFFWMFLAGILVNLVQFAIKIFLARLLSPQDFGIMAIIISLVSFVSFFQDLGLGTALVQRKDKVQESFNSVFVFVTFLGVIFSSIFVLFSKNIAYFFNTADLSNSILIVALTFPFSAATVPFFAHICKNLLFFRRFLAETLPVIFGSCLSLILALFGFGYMSLVIGYVAGSMSYAVLIFILSPFKLSLKFDLSLLKEILHYSKYIFFVNITAIILSQGDNFIVAKFLGSEQLGYYALAYSLATLPSVNMAHILSRVLFPLFAHVQDSKEVLKTSFIKSVVISTTIVFPIISGMLLVSSFIFVVILNSKWLPAYLPFVILLSLALFKSLSVIPSFFLQATGSSKIDSKIMISSVVLMLLLFLPLTYEFGIIGASLAMSAAYFFGFVSYILVCSKQLNLSRQILLKSAGPAFLSSVLMYCFGLVVIYFLSSSNFINLLIIIGSCSVFYFFLTILINRAVISELKPLLFNFLNRNQ